MRDLYAEVDAKKKAIDKLQNLKYFPSYAKLPLFDDDGFSCLFADKNNPSLIVDIARLFPSQFYTDDVAADQWLKVAIKQSFTREIYDYQVYWQDFFLSKLLSEFRHQLSNHLQRTLIPIPQMNVYLEPYIDVRALERNEIFLEFYFLYKFFVIDVQKGE